MYDEIIATCENENIDCVIDNGVVRMTMLNCSREFISPLEIKRTKDINELLRLKIKRMSSKILRA
jgi:hypothetical protein